MVAIKLPVFAGMVPSVDDHLLPDPNAAYARDTWLYSGALDGLPVDTELYAARNTNTGIVYRIPGNLDDPAYLPGSRWLEFANPNTDFVRAPVAGDTFSRFYWASSSDIPRYNTLARILAGQPAFILGLPQATQPTVGVDGGSGQAVSRAYVATLVTRYGEEGPASAPVLVNGFANSTYTVTVGGVPASDRGVDRDVVAVNIYRTIVTASGTANYFFVHTVPAQDGNQSFIDSGNDALISQRRILESTAWTAPPSNLQGFVVMPNGILAGWRGNELWFSEAYRPHAWPAAYSLTLEFDIVGLGVVNQTLVVCTEGKPITASGVNPRSITTATLASFEPCLSRGSIVSSPEGVYYTSPNGLILVNAGVAENITRKVISRDKWTGLTGRTPVRAGRLGTSYFAFGAGLPPSFQTDAFQANAVQPESSEGSMEGFMIDPFNENAGVSYLSAGANVLNVMNDGWSGELLVLKGGKVTWMDQRLGYDIKPYLWRSKVFQSPDQRNFAALKAYFYVPAKWASFNFGPLNNTLQQMFNPLRQMALIRVYADGKLVATRELQKPGDLCRLPSGFKADFWQIEIEAQVKMKSIQMATSVQELRNV